MAVVRRVRSKGLPTEGALERLLARMLPDVCAQDGACREGLGAVGTLIGPLS